MKATQLLRLNCWLREAPKRCHQRNAGIDDSCGVRLASTFGSKGQESHLVPCGERFRLTELWRPEPSFPVFILVSSSFQLSPITLLLSKDRALPGIFLISASFCGTALCKDQGTRKGWRLPCRHRTTPVCCRPGNKQDRAEMMGSQPPAIKFTSLRFQKLGQLGRHHAKAQAGEQGQESVSTIKASWDRHCPKQAVPPQNSKFHKGS